MAAIDVGSRSIGSAAGGGKVHDDVLSSHQPQESRLLAPKWTVTLIDGKTGIPTVDASTGSHRSRSVDRLR
jgi:hypothetical protein